MENEILNFTKVEEDPFAHIDANVPNVSKLANEWNHWKPTPLQKILTHAYLIFGIVKFFTVIAVVLVDILIIYLILRYKRLRKNFNLYILHFAILNLTGHIIEPLFLIAHILVRSGFKSVHNVYCYMDMLKESLLYVSFIFIICLALDWSIFYFKDTTGSVQKAYKHKFAILYSLLGLFSFINCSTCNLSIYSLASDILFFSMPPFAVALLFIHYKRRSTILNNEQLKTEHYLWVSTIVFVVYIPLYLMDGLFRAISHETSVVVITALIAFEEMFSIISVVSPICILVYLMKWNKHIRMAFDTTFRRTVREYGSDNLDDASDNEEIVGDDVQKTTAVTNGATAQNIFVP
ncbi:hypothetical protein WA026_012122 [Henosepilachna vigintioctopunctata]|uniref:G-protein coupled receptors family 1 profile domain-containing protein n=1 Tax=Henosepilachna vigintioctopunctata TaxID=420089 RepID=A0AAW1VFH4_9CUCU